MHLSKRALNSSFYEAQCPQCSYSTPFTASDIVQREFLNCCPTKKDYYTIDYDIKCQMCLARFKPQAHRTKNAITNPMKPRFSDIQKSYIARMTSFAVLVPTGMGSLRLNQLVNTMKRNPNYDCLSVFLVDEVGSLNSDVAYYVTGQNLSADALHQVLGVHQIVPIPVAEAMDYHLNRKPQMLGDVSHVFRT